MDLYKIKKDILESIERDPFKLEREIQSVVETNVETLFGLEFVKTEFSIGKFRLDSICFDNDTNSFVIIEYKKGK
jgi:RecB family endonuclease NucS